MDMARAKSNSTPNKVTEAIGWLNELYAQEGVLGAAT